MAEVTAEQLHELDPYIAGERPDPKGEVPIYCPLHPDTKRSASLNVRKGVWCCHAGCGGGSVRQLVASSDAWIPAEGRVAATTKSSSVGSSNGFYLPTEQDVAHWHRRLRREYKVHRRLENDRGINNYTIRKALLGWDGRNYKIPVFGPRRCLWNVRNYNPEPGPGRSKIWNTRGMGEPRLYPYGILERARLGDSVLFCEGEWDTLLALQYDIPAVTHTDGAAKNWHDEWTPEFAGLRVYLCHDADDAGDKSHETITDAIADIADVFQCHLPYRHQESGGNDLTDYLLEFSEENRRYMLIDLMDTATRRA